MCVFVVRVCVCVCLYGDKHETARPSVYCLVQNEKKAWRNIINTHRYLILGAVRKNIQFCSTH